MIDVVFVFVILIIGRSRGHETHGHNLRLPVRGRSSQISLHDVLRVNSILSSTLDDVLDVHGAIYSRRQYVRDINSLDVIQ